MSAFSDGPDSAPLLIIGMSPGREELEHNRPFVGGSGRLLWSLLRRAGIDRSMVKIVNVCGDFPEGKNGNLTPEQIERWWDRFDQAVHQATARVCLLLGGEALTRTTGLTGIEGWRGYLLERSDGRNIERVQFLQSAYKTNTKLHKKGDPKLERLKSQVPSPLPATIQWIIPTIHPASVLRTGGASAPALGADLRRVARALRGDLRIPRTHYSESPRTVWYGPRAFDIETRPDSSIERIGLADDGGTITIPWDSSAALCTTAALDAHAVPKIAHNLAFDLRHLEDVGIQIPDPIFDTMLAAAMLEPDLYKGLESVASLYLDRKRWKHLSAEKPAYYNAQDVSATLELYYILKSELETTGQLDLFQNVIMPGVRVLTKMTRRGIPLNVLARDAWTQSLATQYDEAMQRWYRLVPNVNPNSPSQVAKHLYDVCGLPTRYKNHGARTTDELAIRYLLTDHLFSHGELLGALLDIRRLGRDLKTYARVAAGGDGCVHPNYLPANKDEERRGPNGEVAGKGLAGTWRITAKDPNIQNQPPAARRMFEPPLGLLWYEWDYNQIEARIIATVAEDDALQAAIDAGLHDANMDLLKVDRIRAKNAFYGWSYGAGWKTLMGTFKQNGFEVDAQTCKSMLDLFNSRYRKTAQWRERQMELARTAGYLENPFGLRRYFPMLEQGPAAANFVPQSTAAIILWSILPDLDREAERLGGRILTTVHDSVSAALPSETGVSGIERILGREWPQIASGFQVPATLKIGPNWGTLSHSTAERATSP